MISLALFCGSREIHVDLGALSNILKSQVQDLLKIAVRQQVLWVWASTHPMQMTTLRIGLVPEIGHVPLRIRTVGCIEAIQDVKWPQRFNVADVTVHEQGIVKARVFGFSMFLAVPYPCTLIENLLEL
jgi:hypothetical protein